MINLKPYSSSILSIGGLLLIAMGIYFIFIRPPMLPEDYKYVGTTTAYIQNELPGLTIWLQKVFLVMGGYILTTGILIVYVALSSFRERAKGSFLIVLVAGITSISSMVVVNFILDSDFKWVLLAFTLPWTIALILYRLGK